MRNREFSLEIAKYTVEGKSSILSGYTIGKSIVAFASDKEQLRHQVITYLEELTPIADRSDSDFLEAQLLQKGLANALAGKSTPFE